MTKRHPHSSAPTRAPQPTASRLMFSEKGLNRLIIAVLFAVPFILFARFLFGTRMLFGTDFIGDGGYAARRFMAEYIRTHHTIAFWQPDILCGQPTVAAFFGDLFYPTILLRLILPVHIVWAWTFVLHLFLAGLGTYLFLKEHRIGLLASGLAGIAYMFAGSLVTLTFAGHDGRLIGSALLPFALLFLRRGITGRRFINFLLVGMVIGLQLLSGHVQKVYYTGLLLTAYFIFQLIHQLRSTTPAGLRPSLLFRLVGSFLASFVFAGALAAIQYLPIYGNMRLGARGGDKSYSYATSWSMHPAETFDLLTPRFSGAVDSYSRFGQYHQQAGITTVPTGETYWGPNPFKLHSEYLGIIPLVFAVIAILRLWRRREVKFFFFSFVGTLVMAWGGHTFLYRLPYHLLPGIAKFRGPAMIFFVAAFSLVTLAGFGVSYVLSEVQKTPTRRPPSRLLRPALLAGLVPLGLLLFIIMLRDRAAPLLGATSPQKAAAFAANLSNVTFGLLLATVLWAVGYTLAFLALTSRLKPVPFAGIAAAVMILDITLSLNLWNEQRGYIPGIPPPHQYFAADRVVRTLKTDSSLFRVLPVPRHYEHDRNGLLWLHGIQSASGSIPNPLQTWQEFIGADTLVGFVPFNLFDSIGLRRNFIDLLNIKYVIAQGRGGPTVYPNDSVLPRTFVVSSFELMPNKDALLHRLSQPDFVPGRTALLYEEPGIPPVTAPAADSATGAAEIVLYDANRIVVNATLHQPGILVLSENYHPDWRVKVDGQPAKLLQAYHTLRAVALTPGEHSVEFWIVPRYYRLGTVSTLAATALLVLLSLVTIIHRKPACHSADS